MAGLALGDGVETDRLVKEGSVQDGDGVPFWQADVSRDEWQVKSRSVRAGVCGDGPNHANTGNAGRQEGAATEQSTHSAVGSRG